MTKNSKSQQCEPIKADNRIKSKSETAKDQCKVLTSRTNRKQNKKQQGTNRKQSSNTQLLLAPGLRPRVISQGWRQRFVFVLILILSLYSSKAVSEAMWIDTWAATMGAMAERWLCWTVSFVLWSANYLRCWHSYCDSGSVCQAKEPH